MAWSIIDAEFSSSPVLPVFLVLHARIHPVEIMKRQDQIYNEAFAGGWFCPDAHSHWLHVHGKGRTLSYS